MQVDERAERSLLKVSGLTVAFGDGAPVVDDVLPLALARAHAGAGRESGSGKSVTALAIVRLLAPGRQDSAGRIDFQGQDLIRASEAELRDIRGARISMVFQEPMTSLNPLHRIERQIGEILEWHGMGSRRSAALARWNCCAKSACKTPNSGWTPSPTNCPAASASG